MWILPTLNRPEQCEQVLERISHMECATPGYVFLNGGIKGYENSWLPAGWDVVVLDKNIGALGALNTALEIFPDEPWYGFIGDDEFVNTPGFDEMLIAAAGDWNIAHGNDGFNKGARFQGYAVVGGKLARAVGCLALKECNHWYGFDSMWESLAQAGACKKIFMPDVRVDHQHPYHGKGKVDSCYELGASQKDIDQQVYFHWLRHGIKDVVDRAAKAKAV